MIDYSLFSITDYSEIIPILRLLLDYFYSQNTQFSYTIPILR